MVNRPRISGTKGESDFVNWMHEQGERQVERHALHGSKDVGDINGIPSLVVSVKRPGKLKPKTCDCGRAIKPARAFDFSGWLNDVQTMRRNATRVVDEEPPAGLLVVRRVGYPDVGDWFAVQRMSDWWELYRELLT